MADSACRSNPRAVGRSRRADPHQGCDTDRHRPTDRCGSKADILGRVRQKAQSRLWNEYIQRYHYLGHTPLPGAQLRYRLSSAEPPIAALGFGAAPWQSAPRDRCSGWTHEQ
ncbi:MAG: DUF4338 domain-containing protein, partial [Sulfitobacter sp.]|nr:DUF4338 domain-containing protein [Sulfitobacter sp.]